ncbi:MAG TPA: hypothetical protein VMH26_13010 [Burkholderiales bacterium]|nr:hypothetical protein [Burkholderiales bacterium]
MKPFLLHALVLGAYVLVLALYAWTEHEPFVAALGIVPVLLFMVVRALDARHEEELGARGR